MKHLIIVAMALVTLSSCDKLFNRCPEYFKKFAQGAIYDSGLLNSTWVRLPIDSTTPDADIYFCRFTADPGKAYWYQTVRQNPYTKEYIYGYDTGYRLRPVDWDSKDVLFLAYTHYYPWKIQNGKLYSAGCGEGNPSEQPSFYHIIKSDPKGSVKVGDSLAMGMDGIDYEYWLKIY